MSSIESTTSVASPSQWFGNGAIPSQPSEAATSYFPERRPSSGSISSSNDSPTETPFTRPSASPTGDNPLPPIDTPFPKPDGDIDVAAQLAKKPLPRSLHSSLKRAATLEKKAKVEDPEARARALAEAKKVWLSWK
ncbi:hypothetical protein DL768_006194 [Monosporascus sp. mg162]|nr:hypothetical protein DL768_006194 [Monosporascus sp. mg162]